MSVSTNPFYQSESATFYGYRHGKSRHGSNPNLAGGALSNAAKQAGKEAGFSGAELEEYVAAFMDGYARAETFSETGE